MPNTSIEFYENQKRKLAYALMMAGADASPVKHWTQGAARALQGAMGGYEAYKLDQEDKAATETLKNLPGLDSSPAPTPAPAPMAPPQRVPVDQPAPQPQPRRPVMPGPKVWGDKEAEDAGLYPSSQPAAFNDRFAGLNPQAQPGAMQPTPVQTERIGNPAIAQPVGAPQRSSVSIPPDVAGSLRTMIANPRTRAQGLALYSQYAKPSDQYVPVQDARGNVVGQRSQLTGEIKTVPQDPESVRIVQEMRANPTAYGFKGPNDPALHEAMQKRLSGMTTNVAVNSVANPILEGVGKQFVAARDRASNAVDAIKMGHDARALLDEGMTTGAFADPRVMMQKVGALFGMDASQASNSEVFRGVIGQQVLSHIKALGANPSNADRDYIEKIQGGQIALEENSLRRLLDINEKYSRQAIQRFNSDSQKLVGANPEQYRQIAPLMQFEEPPAYQPRAAQPTPQQIQDELRRRNLR
jgi:hypothetical protein